MRGRPLRLVFWTWSVAVALALASAAVWSVDHGAGDWRVFVAAGSLAGTHALIAPPQAWQIFVYLPGAAWAFVPVARLPLAVSFYADAVLMLACAAAAGAVAARTYGLARAVGCGLYVLWAPVVYAAAIIGQNAPFGLLLAQLTIAGIARRSVALTALPLGLLLYKPTYALPLIAVLLLRARLRELGAVVVIGAGWYVVSAAATGGDWRWPAEWAALIARYAPGDLSVNAAFVVSLPALLARAGAGLPAIAAIGALIALAVAVAVRRAGAVEAASAACLAGVALSPHALAYDAALALPMIAYTASRLTEPARTRLLLALFIVAPLFFVSPLLRFDPLALLVIGGTCAWLYVRVVPRKAAVSASVREW
ncbi:MAG TPA: glycosyltransferase 87 family protein [Candidatus Elarobacter sp.]|nr:glycosyltransferase 87 family protein [Candidatus Elarobacter sp.]